MKIITIKTPIFKPQQDLLNFLDKQLPVLSDGDVVVVTSKIVALAEGRIISQEKRRSKLSIIKKESELMIKTKYVYLTIKDGDVMANAGIDESNANGDIILLPKNSFLAAEIIRNYLKKKFRLRRLGVIISDSRCLPLRAGITGVTLGYAGFRGIKDYRQKTDIFNRPFKFSRVNVADSLAAAAVLCMGEGKERRPLAVISDSPIVFVEKIVTGELKIDIAEDIYGPLFKQIL